ncbi:MAG: cupredoxin domain-containing protein [Patescibacteria group bacterium]|mgnify:CR=1 FL=1
MKRLFFLFGALVLLGGGCGSSPTVSPATTATPSATVSSPMAPIVPADDAATPAALVATPPVTPSVAEPEILSVAMTTGNFFFDPATITTSPGQEVSISFTDNEGTHTFLIDEIGLKKTITTGTVVTFTAPTTPGNYAYYCDIGAHRKLGMEGVLIVK